MKTIFRIAQTELRLFFYSPIAWLILIIFAFQAGMAFCDTFSYQLQNKALGRGQIPFQTVILLLGDSGSFFKVLNNLYLYIPLLTMALMSREYSSGSIKLLYSSPVTNFQIIGGKFLAMMLYGGLMLVILCLFGYRSLYVYPDFLPDRGSGRYTGDTYLLEFCRRTLAGYSCRTGDYLVAVFVGTGQNVYGRTDMQ